MDKKLIREVYETGLNDPVYFCRTVLSAWFPKRMPWLHRGLLALMTRQTEFLLNFGEEKWRDEEGTWSPKDLDKVLRHFTWSPTPDDKNAKRLPIFKLVWHGTKPRIEMQVSQIQQEIMPRGFSKTTLCNAVVLWYTVYRLKQFLVFCAETGPHAASQLANVKEQLESNQVIHEVYGRLAPERNDAHVWRENEAHTMNDVWLVARGRGGQVRGLNRGGIRPQMIIVDDVEDEESVLTDVQRKKTLKWFMRAVRPALPRNDSNAFIQMLGTLLHSECLLLALSQDPTVITTTFGAVDPDGEMLWNSHMSRRQYDALKQSYRAVGDLSGFVREFDSKISDEESRIFDTSRIVYIAKHAKQFVSRALALDPAISEEAHADFCAFAVVGMEDSGLLHVLDVFMKKGMSPREQVDKFFEMKVMWNCTAVGIEAISFQKALIHLVKEEMFRKSAIFGNAAYFEIVPIIYNNDLDKIKRVQGVLAPRFSAGYITFQRRFLDLEAQLDDWPAGKLDGPDVVSMAITLLDPVAGAALPGGLDSDAGGKVLGEDRWGRLEDMVGGDWHYRGI